MATSPRLPAASDVRMGQAEVQALVQRLRRVATKERERRAKGKTVGGAAGGAASEGGGSGGDGEPKVPLQVKTAMEELRRVVVHGDATTLDVLLSSQVGGDYLFCLLGVLVCREHDSAQQGPVCFFYVGRGNHTSPVSGRAVCFSVGIRSPLWW